MPLTNYAESKKALQDDSKPVYQGRQSDRRHTYAANRITKKEYALFNVIQLTQVKAILRKLAIISAALSLVVYLFGESQALAKIAEEKEAFFPAKNMFSETPSIAKKSKYAGAEKDNQPEAEEAALADKRFLLPRVNRHIKAPESLPHTLRERESVANLPSLGRTISEDGMILKNLNSSPFEDNETNQPLSLLKPYLVASSGVTPPPTKTNSQKREAEENIKKQKKASEDRQLEFKRMIKAFEDADVTQVVPGTQEKLASELKVQLLEAPSTGQCMRAFGLRTQDGQYVFTKKSGPGAIIKRDVINDLGIMSKAQKELLISKGALKKQSVEYFDTMLEPGVFFNITFPSEKKCLCIMYKETAGSREAAKARSARSILASGKKTGVSRETLLPGQVCDLLWKGGVPFTNGNAD